MAFLTYAIVVVFIAIERALLLDSDLYYAVARVD
jgi:hypothetical protein